MCIRDSTKSAEKVNSVRPSVGAGLFGEEEPSSETEVTNEVEPQEEEESDETVN